MAEAKKKTTSKKAAPKDLTLAEQNEISRENWKKRMKDATTYNKRPRYAGRKAQ